MTEQPRPHPYGGPHLGGFDSFAPVPDHPRSTLIMALGIASLASCQILGPVAWVMASGAKREIEQSGGRLGGMQQVRVGLITGIVATVILVLSLLFLALIIASAIAST